MYSLHFYGEMMADTGRVQPYVEALRQTVKPDSVVLDLGCGPGLFALLACKFGARRVYAVEPDNTINIAREAAAANGLANRIEFFQKLSAEIMLPELATVVIFDLRGVLPWFTQNVTTISDARTRLLAPDAVLIPRRDLLWATIVEAPDQFQQIVAPWQDKNFNVDLSAGVSKITNTWRKTKITTEGFLSEPLCCATLDYTQVANPELRAEISWSAQRSGTMHGVAAWFDADLADGIGFSNHPAAPELVYGQAFFPLSRPVAVSEGEQVEVKLRADHVQNEYVWSWTTDFADQKIHFEQSTFYGVPLSPELLKEKYAQ
jgi:type I protein arginine methyltransferase